MEDLCYIFGNQNKINMFSKINVDLGNVKSGKMQVASFPYNGELIHKIVRMISPCDCSVPENDVANQRVIVRFTPKPVPQHLKLQGVLEYTTTKSITVELYKKDSTNIKSSVILNITAKVSD